MEPRIVVMGSVAPVSMDDANVADARTTAAASNRGPLPRTVAAGAVLRCIGTTVRLLLLHRTHLPRERVGMRLHFADGTSARVFRETTVDGVSAEDPCLLVVKFRLRLLRGRWHKLFLTECILNTPLFVGFPGFMSKLWLDRDEREVYRGHYEWSDPGRAEHYARSLWRVLELVCEPGSIDYVVLPGCPRLQALQSPGILASSDKSGDSWWRVVESSGPGLR
jgi:hypothetical protein